MSWYWRVRLVILGVVIVALLGFGAYWGVVTMLHARAVAPFKPHLAEYLAPPAGPAAPGPVKGKMIVLDRKTGDVDWDVFFALPAGLRAERPEDVGTVVLIDWSKQRVDSYKNGAPAYQQFGKATVIDQVRRAVVGSVQVQGSEPPMEIDSNASEGNGSKPSKDIVNYLQSLPRQ